MQQEISHSPFLMNAVAWLDKNRKQVVMGAGGVLLLAAVIGFYLWAKSEKEINAGKSLSQALMALGRGESPDAMLRVAMANAGTAAGAQAQLLAAGALFTGGKFTEAQAQFESFIRDYATSPLAPQARLGVAASLAAQGKTDDAARAYKELVDRAPGASTAPQAKFALASIYEAQGKLEAALGLYEEVARGEMNPRGEIGSALGSEAGMRAEEVRLKLPPVPPLAIPTNAPAAAISPNAAAPVVTPVVTTNAPVAK
jgi:predicted negative regulator of RcsB-dependent stress response